MVDLRGVPLPVSTLRTVDSLVNRRTYTLARGPVLEGGSVRPHRAACPIGHGSWGSDCFERFFNCGGQAVIAGRLRQL